MPDRTGYQLDALGIPQLVNVLQAELAVSRYVLHWPEVSAVSRTQDATLSRSGGCAKNTTVSGKVLLGENIRHSDLNAWFRPPNLKTFEKYF